MNQKEIQDILNSFSASKIAHRTEKQAQAINKSYTFNYTKAVKLLKSLSKDARRIDAVDLFEKKLDVRDREHAKQCVAKVSRNLKWKFKRANKQEKYAEFIKQLPKDITKEDAALKFNNNFYFSSLDIATVMFGNICRKINCNFKVKDIRKTVVTPLGTFCPQTDALIAHGKNTTNRKWLVKQLKDDPKNYYYVDANRDKVDYSKNVRRKNNKTVRTPLGTFSPIVDALIAHGKDKAAMYWIGRKLKSDPDNFYYCDTNGKRIKK